MSSLILPPDFQEAAQRTLLRPPPVFSEDDLSTLIRFVQASGVRPEGMGGAKFDIATRPYLKVLYNERRDKPFRRLVIMKAAQTGLTIKLLYRAMWWTANARKRINTALLFPSLELVQDLHRSRFRPMMQSSSKLMRLAGDVDMVGLVRLGPSSMRFRGMRSGAGLDSFPADILLLDEVRLMAIDAIRRAMVRLTQSTLRDPSNPDDGDSRGIIELNSTAGWPNLDIDKWFQRSTMNYWRTPCPNSTCKNHRTGIIMPLRWPDIVGRDGRRFYYQCPDCGVEIPDEILMREGHYIAENPGAKWEGYQFSQILLGAGMLPELWEEFQSGDNTSEFYNSRLGIPWQDPEAVPATQERIESCITNDYLWPEPEQVVGEWVSMGIDQRAGEKHVVILKLGSGGSWDLVHLEVVEASGMEAVEKLCAIARRWHAKIVVPDGEPSYDLAFELARRLGRIVWLQDYAEEQKNPIQFIDSRDDEKIRKVTGEIKWDQRVLLDRYQAAEYTLTKFNAKRFRLPGNLYTGKSQQRRVKGVVQQVAIAQEWVLHLQNYGRSARTVYDRPDGFAPVPKKVVKIYRMLAMDPHFTHATIYAVAGLTRLQGTSSLHLTAVEDPIGGTIKTAVDAALPRTLRPTVLAEQAAKQAANTCGSCRFWNPANTQCGNKLSQFNGHNTPGDAAGCRWYRAI